VLNTHMDGCIDVNLFTEIGSRSDMNFFNYTTGANYKLPKTFQDCKLPESVTQTKS
jgi:hypothetical protein